MGSSWLALRKLKNSRVLFYSHFFFLFPSSLPSLNIQDKNSLCQCLSSITYKQSHSQIPYEGKEEITQRHSKYPLPNFPLSTKYSNDIKTRTLILATHLTTFPQISAHLFGCVCRLTSIQFIQYKFIYVEQTTK